MRIREIQKTIRAQYLHEQAWTTIPTPRAQQSPHAESSVPSALENARKSELLPLLPFPENRASVFSRGILGFVTPSMLKHYRTQFNITLNVRYIKAAPNINFYSPQHNLKNFVTNRVVQSDYRDNCVQLIFSGVAFIFKSLLCICRECDNTTK